MNKTFLYGIFGLALLVGTIQSCLGQERYTRQIDLQQSLKDGRLNPVNRAVAPLPDDGHKDAIRFDRRDAMGLAWVQTGDFSDGTIEFDVRGTDDYQRCFVGVAFHGLNDTTMEVIYLRPFNFKATDTLRKVHAIQYVCLPRYDWSVLRSRFPGHYEKGIVPPPEPDSWVHVRIVVKGPEISAYINHSDSPSLVVQTLAPGNKGRLVGLWVGNNSIGDFANLKISAEERTSP